MLLRSMLLRSLSTAFRSSDSKLGLTFSSIGPYILPRTSSEHGVSAFRNLLDNLYRKDASQSSSGHEPLKEPALFTFLLSGLVLLFYNPFSARSFEHCSLLLPPSLQGTLSQLLYSLSFTARCCLFSFPLTFDRSPA